MAYQTVFQRYELKYILAPEQARRLLAVMAPYMDPDRYGRTTICNLYFDTDNYRLIRHSIEKPAYKEKLRLRSYGRAEEDTPVFVELKRKCSGVVYKRRVSAPEEAAMAWLTGSPGTQPSSQISREIDYFLAYYENLKPRVFLSYERRAWYAKDDPAFRVTFDENILCRQEDLSLRSPVYGQPVLPGGQLLLEIKCAGGIPLWMTDFLSREKLYKTSFSKYGMVYQTVIYPKLKETANYAG